MRRKSNKIHFSTVHHIFLTFVSPHISSFTCIESSFWKILSTFRISSLWGISWKNRKKVEVVDEKKNQGRLIFPSWLEIAYLLIAYIEWRKDGRMEGWRGKGEGGWGTMWCCQRRSGLSSFKYFSQVRKVTHCHHRCLKTSFLFTGQEEPSCQNLFFP